MAKLSQGLGAGGGDAGQHAFQMRHFVQPWNVSPVRGFRVLMPQTSHITLTVAREHQGWYVLGEDRLGPFADKEGAQELATAMAAFFRTVGMTVSVHMSIWISGPRSHETMLASLLN
jgi:hypothetical protein